MKLKNRNKQTVVNLGGLVLSTFLLLSCQVNSMEQEVSKKSSNMSESNKNVALDTATFGAGCFWCVEAVFEDLKGVESVVSGYSGGEVINPSYKEVCTGRTGHAEVCQIIYDPKVISFEELLEVFWVTHDPTTLNGQGADSGTQYRSAIFYHNDSQKDIAERYKVKLNASDAFDDPIVTEITEYTNFFAADNYHQEYFKLNGEQPYCRAVIKPKVDKFKKVFKDRLKE